MGDRTRSGRRRSDRGSLARLLAAGTLLLGAACSRTGFFDESELGSPGTCDASGACACTPVCTDKACGASDGCGGTCQTGSCACTPDCTAKACGASDGCGGVCNDHCAFSSGASAIAAGWAHSCAIASGGLQCWGDNSTGELGNGATQNSSVPVSVSSLSSGVTAVAAGNNYTCAIASGGVQCWGTNDSGQLGNGSTTGSLTPVGVVGLSSGVIAISTGFDHACAVIAGGGAECWGSNAHGQLGDGSSADSYVPVAVSGLSSGVTAIAAGDDATCAITSGGSLSCWGDDFNGELGNDSFNDSSVPVPADIPPVSMIMAGGSYACAALKNGGADCWGNGGLGQLGSGSSYTPTPTPVTGLSSGVTTVTAGEAHACALVAGGAQCWGDNTSGDVGNDSTTYTQVPSGVLGLSSGVAAIAAGGTHTCALTYEGGVLCWGLNSAGQLGNNATTDSPTPVKVVGL